MQEKYDLLCPYCDSVIAKSSDNEVKMRVKLVKWEKGGMFAVCKGCSEDVQVDEDFLKSVRKRFVYEVEK